jgi:hypothetical protein
MARRIAGDPAKVGVSFYPTPETDHISFRPLPEDRLNFFPGDPSSEMTISEAGANVGSRRTRRTFRSESCTQTLISAAIHMVARPVSFCSTRH